MRKFINLIESMKMEKWSEADISAILKEAKRLGLDGFGGACGEAAIAINDMIFEGEAVLVGAVNKAFFEHGSFLGHVAVRYEGVYWDADGVPKEESDVDHWGMLEFNDPDHKAHAAKLGIDWTEEAAETVEIIEFDDDEVLEYFNGGRLNGMLDIIDQAIINHQEK